LGAVALLQERVEIGAPDVPRLARLQAAQAALTALTVDRGGTDSEAASNRRHVQQRIICLGDLGHRYLPMLWLTLARPAFRTAEKPWAPIGHYVDVSEITY
jgi:hypothetical protein